MIRCLLIFILLLFSTTFNAYAATYYVAKTGGGSECSQASPCLTIAVGISKLSAGDTLIIKAGTYAEIINNSIPSGSSPTFQVTVRSAPGETVTIRPAATLNHIVRIAGSYIIFDGIIVDGVNMADSWVGVKIDAGAHHVSLQNSTVKNIQTQCVQVVKETNDITVRNNEVYDCGTHATSDFYTLQPGSHAIYTGGFNNVYENNLLHDVTGFGIQLFSQAGSLMSDNIIRNNIIYNAQNKGGIFIGSTSENLLIYNNIIYDVGSGITVRGTDTQVYNNVIYNTTSSACIRRAPEEPFTSEQAALIKNNISYLCDGSGNTYTPSGNFTTNPSFVSPGTGNFKLNPGSGAINTATTLTAVQTDFDGITRPQPAGGNYDHGAYEFITAVPQTPYLGTAWPAPGTIEAENYDEGGSGVAYVDTTSGNSGGVYRTDDVDIEATTDTGGGFQVGFVKETEWLEYTIDVATTGTYDIETRVAALGNGGTFNYSVDGGAPTATQTVPNTGAWDAYTTLSTPISLTAGTRILRLSFLTDGTTTFSGFVGNFNWINLAGPDIPPPDITTGLVAHWTFDNTVDDSAGSNDGTLVSGATYTEDGRVNQALLLDGIDDYVSAPYVGLDNRSFSIAGWIYADNLSSNREWFSQHTGFSANNSIHFRVTTAGSIHVDFFENGITSAAGLIDAASWYHAVLTFDNATKARKIYIDAAEAASDTSASAFLGTAGSTMIGRYSGGRWLGRIDDVRIYHRALAPADVTELYNLGEEPIVDETAPTDPSNLTATGVSSSHIRLTWIGSTDEGGSGVSHYEIERCEGAACETWTQIDTVVFGGLSHGDATGLTASALYRYRIRAVDNATNPSAYSNIAEANAVDETPPDVPSDLEATAISSSQIDLVWVESTDVDGSGVLHYEIERAPGPACDTWAEIDTVLDGTLTYSNTTGLSASTAYCYRVRAEDNATNVSGYSDIAEATTLDGTPPTDPTNLAATVISTSRIDLSWDVSTDAESGVANYEVYRCTPSPCTPTTLIDEPVAASYSDTTGLSPGTGYSYRVRAKNGVDLFSGYSNTEDATTSSESVMFSGNPTALSATASGTVAFSGSPSTLSDTASTTPIFASAPTGLSATASGTVTFAGPPTNLGAE